MDLATTFSNMSAARTMGEVQMAVAKKMLDSQRMQGAAAVQLIQAAANTGAKAGDALVAQATGLGGSLDTYG